MKPSRESLRSGHIREPLLPGGTPVARCMSSPRFPRRSACCVSHGFPRLFEGIGVTAVATLHTSKLSGGDDVVAVAAAGDVPGEPVVSNHR